MMQYNDVLQFFPHDETVYGVPIKMVIGCGA